MSATTVLVPLLEREGEALVEGGEARGVALDAIVARAGLLRPRVARVDAIREELHGLLFAQWPEGRERPVPYLLKVLRSLRPPRPVVRTFGYDPFVQLFGRSLPIEAPSPKAVAERLARLLTLDAAEFEAQLTADLRGLDPAAGALFSASTAPPPPEGLDASIRAQARTIEETLASPSPSLRTALKAVVRLSAWSQPVWRFDGEMLPDLLRTLGIELAASGARELFEGLVERRPGLEPLLKKLPARLEDFAGVGAFLTSTDVRVLAGALRLQRQRIAQNARDNSENMRLALRHLRLLEEAVFFCEAQGLALAEAAGVEWHDREQ